jgi:hypothetical protein
MKAPEELGAEVLARGLPALPEVLTYQMSIPVAYWTASRSAVVLFLHFRQRDFEVPPAGAAHDEVTPMVMMVTFSLDGERWTADPMWYSTGWSHDSIAKPGSLRDLDGRAIAGGGGEFSDQPGPHYPAAIATGRAAAAVKQIALIQDGREDRRRLESHFGAWVICTEQTSPFQVTALDENGVVLDSIPYK